MAKLSINYYKKGARIHICGPRYRKNARGQGRAPMWVTIDLHARAHYFGYYVVVPSYKTLASSLVLPSGGPCGGPNRTLSKKGSGYPVLYWHFHHKAFSFV